MTTEYRDDVIKHANKTVSRVEEHQDAHANAIEDGNDDGEDDGEEERDIAESSFMVSTPAENEGHESETSVEDGGYRPERVSKRPLICSPRSLRSGSRRKVGGS
jgi:hypothetical protein